MDAAFEAYVGLYRVGLINDNLLPLPSYDKEAAKAYTEVAKRPAVALVNRNYNPWVAVRISRYGGVLTALSSLHMLLF